MDDTNVAATPIVPLRPNRARDKLRSSSASSPATSAISSPPMLTPVQLLGPTASPSTPSSPFSPPVLTSVQAPSSNDARQKSVVNANRPGPTVPLVIDRSAGRKKDLRAAPLIPAVKELPPLRPAVPLLGASDDEAVVPAAAADAAADDSSVTPQPRKHTGNGPVDGPAPIPIVTLDDDEDEEAPSTVSSSARRSLASTSTTGRSNTKVGVRTSGNFSVSSHKTERRRDLEWRVHPAYGSRAPRASSPTREPVYIELSSEDEERDTARDEAKEPPVLDVLSEEEEGDTARVESQDEREGDTLRDETEEEGEGDMTSDETEERPATAAAAAEIAADAATAPPATTPTAAPKKAGTSSGLLRAAGTARAARAKKPPIKPTVGRRSSVGGGERKTKKKEIVKRLSTVHPIPITPATYAEVQKRRISLGDQPYEEGDLLSREESEAAALEDIVREVYERSGEGAAVWDAKWNANVKATGKTQCLVDYIVGSNRRHFTSADKPVRILVKYNEYPVPNWENGAAVAGNPMADYLLRLACGDLIECSIRREMGDAQFDRVYPNRYLEDENGEGTGGYVTKPLSLYHNRLRAIEERMNRVNDRAARPRLYIFDWTSGTEDDKALKDWEYSITMQPDEKVQKLLNEYQLAKNIKCGDGHCTAGCLHNANVHLKHNCCGVNSRIKYDKYDNASYGSVDKKDVEKNLYYECTDECHKDDGYKCSNNAVQRGREQTMVIFRHPIKGWTLRCTEKLENSYYVTDYTGKVQMETSVEPALAKYDWTLSHRLRRDNGKRIRPLVICSAETGNESRFMSHSCVPNVKSGIVCVTRHGRWYSHPTFRACKQIQAGDELTIDYFQGKKAVRTWECHFEYCLCAAAKCRYPEDGGKRRAEIEEEDRLREEAGEEHDGSSSSSDTDEGETEENVHGEDGK